MESQIVSHQQVIKHLRSSWFYFSMISLLIAVFFSMFLSRGISKTFGLHWLVISLGVMVYLIVVLRRGLEHNHRPGENKLLLSLGIGNKMTLFRGIMIACLSGFLFLPEPSGAFAWLPGIIYGTAAVADYLDGFLARRENHISLLGKELDMRLDGLGVMVASVLAIQYGQLPVWYLLVAFARYIFIAGLWLRERFNKATFELPPNVSRRIFAGTQMGFLFVMLLPIFYPPITHLAALFLAVPFLIGFTRDWLVASGAIHPDTQFVFKNNESLVSITTIFVRAFIFGITIWISYKQEIPKLTDQEWLLILSSFLTVIAATMIVLGFAGRTGAVIGMVGLGIFSLSEMLMIEQIFLIAAFIFIFFAGTGDYSLWKPEENFLSIHSGGSRQGFILEQSN